MNGNLHDISKSRYFYLGLAAAVLMNLGVTLWSGLSPRKPQFDHLTLPQVISRTLYNTKQFDNDKTVKGHRSKLEKLLKNGTIDNYKKEVWKYVQFWYARKEARHETGDGMEPLSNIVRGVPGSCTEGSVSYWATMRRIKEDPVTEHKLNHYLLLITYERSDGIGIAGHMLYLNECVDKGGNKKYFIGGINPFEDPRIEYDSVEEIIKVNTDNFRVYAWKSLADKNIMIRPKKFCFVDPRHIKGVDLVYGEDRLNKPAGGRDSRETYAQYTQRKFREYFEKHAKEYNEEK